MCEKQKLTYRQAQLRLVDAVIKRNRGKQQRRERRIYYCPECKAHHLTSKPKRRPAA